MGVVHSVHSIRNMGLEYHSWATELPTSMTSSMFWAALFVFTLCIADSISSDRMHNRLLGRIAGSARSTRMMGVGAIDSRFVVEMRGARLCITVNQDEKNTALKY